jgi:signal transduction histidine kinase
VTEGNPELRILVLARVGRDSELLCAALHHHGFACAPLSTPDQVFEEMARGAGAAIITEESFNGSSHAWGYRLQAQPAWSDFPIIILTAGGSPDFRARMPVYRSYGNITLLERPLRSETLLSAVETAVRARLRQYEIRDYVHRQAESQEALRRTEKLAVAGRMAASIAHEINNPLAAVTNLLYLISTSKDLESVRKYNAIAQDELRRISDIANQTLRFYRSPAAPEEADVGQIADSAIALFRAKLRTQKIAVHRKYADERQIMVCVGELRQVLVNLIANAIDAMQKGGNLCIRTDPTSHPADLRPGMKITVADDGEGIPASVRHRLFQPFFTTKGTIGTGLGLWLTKDIVDRNGGYIRCRNHHSPSGAVFSIWLPLTPQVNWAAPQLEARAS